MRAKRAEGKVGRSRDLKKVRGEDVSARFRAAAKRSRAARLDGGASATAVEPRSARADRSERVTVGPALG